MWTYGRETAMPDDGAACPPQEIDGHHRSTMTPPSEKCSSARTRRLLDLGCTITTGDTHDRDLTAGGGRNVCRVTLPDGFVVVRDGPSREQAQEAALSAADLILRLLGHWDE